MIHPRIGHTMRGQRSWWKSGRQGPVRSLAFWKKYRDLVEPLLHFIPYGAAGKRKTKSADVALMSQFQSLGDNCEFGLVQGQLGAHPLGFYRFANTTIDGLIAAFENRFIALQSPENIIVKYREFPNGEFEYVTTVLQYQFYSHTGYQSDTLSADEVQNKEMKRLNFLARTLIEDAETGKKIFVYKSNVPIAEQRIEKSSSRNWPPWSDLASMGHSSNGGLAGRTRRGGFRASLTRFHRALRALCKRW